MKKTALIAKLFLNIVMIMGILSGIAHPVWAGIVKVTVDKGTDATISWNGGGQAGTIKGSDTTLGLGDDGLIFITIDQEIENVIKKITVEKVLNGQPSKKEVDLEKNGNTLASLEPFDIPSFSASTPIFTSIDMVSLLAAGNQFNIGQSFNVIDGIISESSSITFKDGFSLAGDNYTGSVTIDSIDHVAPVPIPATMWLLGSGLIGLFGIRKK